MEEWGWLRKELCCDNPSFDLYGWLPGDCDTCRICSNCNFVEEYSFGTWFIAPKEVADIFLNREFEIDWGDESNFDVEKGNMVFKNARY